MKVSAKIVAAVLAGAVMVSFCSCAGKPATDTSGVASDSTAATSEGDVTETSGTEVSAKESESQADYSDTTYGSLLKLMSGVIGENLDDAEKMIGEFFGEDIEFSHGGGISNTLNDIPTSLHGYVQEFSKDPVRFNGMEISTDPDTGTVMRVELMLKNTDYVTVHIDDTPEFREELKKQYSDLKDELDNTYGEPYQSANLMWDEDSYYHVYKVGNGVVAYIELRDFTSEDENDLLDTSIIFSQWKILNQPGADIDDPDPTTRAPGSDAAGFSDELSKIDEFIKGSKTPENFDKSRMAAGYPYISNRLFALLRCSSTREDVDRWLELYNGLEVTVTYRIADLNHYEHGLFGDEQYYGCRVANFKESANYSNNDFAAVLRDTIKYSLNGSFRQGAYITVKGKVNGGRELCDAELVSWAVADEDRATFESMRLDNVKDVPDKDVVVDYDYVWSKYSDHITTFEH